MTAAARRTCAPAESLGTSDGTLTGVGTVARLMFRRDRVKLPAWVLGIAALWLYYTQLVPTAFEDVETVAGLVDGPMGRMLTGPAYGFDQLDYARLIAGAYGIYVVVLAALMSILLVVRHTRVEEQTGRAELVRANVVGRHAPLTAALVVAAVTNAAVTVAVAVVSVTSPEMGVRGSLLFAVGVGATGMAFAGLAAVTAQVTEFSRAAAGLAGCGLGAAFIVRALGDMASPHGSTLSWLSPFAWSQQTAPFVLDRWWPLGLSLSFAGCATAVAYGLSARRDVGASLVAARAGRDRAPSWLASPLALAARLQRASILGWAASLTAAGLVLGAWTDAVFSSIDDMPDALLDLTGREDVVAGWLGMMALFMALVVAIFAILAVQGLRTEETSGRCEPVLATPVSRRAWLGSHVAVAAAGVVAVLAVTGLAAGIGAAVVTRDAVHILQLTAAHVAHVPAVLLVLAVAALLFGVAPRLIGLAWILLGYSLVAGIFGPLLNLPAWLQRLSPFEHVGRYPADPVAVVPLVVLVLIAAAVAFVGLITFRRREVNVA